MKKTVLGLALFAAAASSAQAAPLIWNLDNVVFSDGGTATGSFIYDADTAYLSQFSISVAGGRLARYLPAHTYDVSNSVSGTNNDRSYFFGDNPGTRYMLLDFASALTNEGGTIGILTGLSSYECTNCGVYRTVTSGSITAAISPVPEPAAWALFMCGFALTGAAMRRRTVAVRFA